MGEVYRSRDPRLGREVAIKILRQDATRDADRLRRFQQEAKAAGALNHPNLLAVFDTGEHEGAPFVVFELLEGETLRQRLAGKALPPPKALDYAIQTARGLVAAHEKGIVHRDLKPENLFLTRDGRVKILDFGLAKLRAVLDSEALGTEAPTVSALTQTGTILGTVAYMAPEQVRGSPSDHRSDIFSFGSILYEMLTGVRPFRGETQAETMTAILNAEPPSLGDVNAKAPGGLEQVVRHCLEKEPIERFQSARDLLFDLELLTPAAKAPVHAAGVPSARRPLLPMLVAAFIGAAVALAGAYARWYRAPPLLVFKQVTFRRQTVAEARFAPDGQTIIYGATVERHHNRIFSARLGSTEVRQLDLPEGDIAGITASGEMAIILSRSYSSRVPGTLARVSLAGGPPRELSEHVSMADWGPDGRSLAVIRHDGPKVRLEYPIGNVLYETNPIWLGYPRVSPRGDRVAFVEWSTEGWSVRTVDRSRKLTTLAHGEQTFSGVAWSPSGDEIWFGEWGILRAVTADGAERVLTRFPGPLAINDVSPDGRVLVTAAQWSCGLMFAGVGDARERDLASLDESTLADLSRDGNVLLFGDRGFAAGPPRPPHSYLRRTDGSPAVHLGEGEPRSLSPDGKWAVSFFSGHPSRCLLLPTGAGEPRPLAAGNLDCSGASWFPDGTQLLVAGREPGRPWRLFVQDAGSNALRPLTPEGFGLVESSLGASPDGRLVLATETSSGTLVLFPAAGGEPRKVLGLGPQETAAGWGADSQSLYVLPSTTQADPPLRIDKLDLRTGRREPFRSITPPELTLATWVRSVRVTPDGKAYAYTYCRFPCILYVIEGLR
jgi:Tol biopolymer transport system component